MLRSSRTHSKTVPKRLPRTSRKAHLEIRTDRSEDAQRALVAIISTESALEAMESDDAVGFLYDRVRKRVSGCSRDDIAVILAAWLDAIVELGIVDPDKRL
jgi:hypothetical protein